MAADACQVAMGAHAEEICVSTDGPKDADARRGYGLPKVSWYMFWPQE